MQLVRLACSQAQRAVAVRVCQVVHRQVQLVGHGARWLLGAHHELVELSGAKAALLTVVLLISAVEFVQLCGILGNERRFRGKLRDEWVPQKVGVLLDDLNLRVQV